MATLATALVVQGFSVLLRGNVVRSLTILVDPCVEILERFVHNHYGLHLGVIRSAVLGAIEVKEFVAVFGELPTVVIPIPSF